MYYDVAWVVVEDAKSKQQSCAVSGGVQFPNSLVEEAGRLGFAKTTVGSLIAKQDKSIDEADPHYYLTNQLVSRTELVKAALRIALGQLQHNKM